ncbi:22459_t:CDS:2, partial [Gigaspora margarita]
MALSDKRRTIYEDPVSGNLEMNITIEKVKKEALHLIKVAQLFDCIGMDIVELLPITKKGHRYLVVSVKYVTKIIELVCEKAKINHSQTNGLVESKEATLTLDLIVELYPVKEVSDKYYDALLLKQTFQIIDRAKVIRYKARLEQKLGGKLEDKWMGPYLIYAVMGNGMYKLYTTGHDEKVIKTIVHGKLEKTIQLLLDKLNKNEELEIKENKKRNKAQQIYENMPLYLQDLDQDNEAEPIMPIEKPVDLERRAKQYLQRNRNSEFLSPVECSYIK